MMSTDERSPLEGGEFTRQRLWGAIFRQMFKGALFAAALILTPVLFIYITYLVGELLPPESKEAVDPTPDSFSEYQRPVELPVASRWA